MDTIKALDERTLADLWREVPLEEEVWSVVRAREQLALKHLLQGALEQELVEQLAASRYRHTEVRRGYRNGFYERDLVTQLGVIAGIRVPRARTRVERRVFRRYQRRHGVVDALIREMFLAGVSTRRVGQVLSVLLGEPVSAQTVSRLARSLDQEVARFHEAPLTDDVRYLLLDGVSMRVKGAAGVKRRLVLCAYGITVSGQRRLFAFRLAQSESAQAWEAFLSQLQARGLAGHGLKLIVTDGCLGLHQALETVYPYVPRQRCWVHKLRNVANLLRAPPAGRVLSRGAVHLPGGHPAGGDRGLLGLGTPLAGRGTQGSGLLGAGSGRVAQLPGLPGAAPPESAHHQRHRARLSGGAPTHPTDELLHKQCQLRADHLRCGDASEQELGGEGAP